MADFKGLGIRANRLFVENDRHEGGIRGKRNFANKWLNHGVNHRDVHSKRERRNFVLWNTSFRNGSTLCFSAFGGKISFINREILENIQ